MRRLMPASVLLLVLCLVLVVFYGIRPVRATVYINVFGVINPSSSPIDRTGNVYTFTADINDAIEIQANNIIVDGAGHSVKGAGIGTGIIVGNVPDLPTVYNVTLENMGINAFEDGVLLRNCLKCSITGVNITVVSNNGVSIYRSSNSSLIENQVWAQTAGIRLDQAYNDTVLWNNVTGSYDGIEVWESSNNTIVENSIANSSWGIRLADSSNNKIYHNQFINNSHQFYLDNEGKDVWDDGFPSGGNYWSDYLIRYPSATEIDSSGIGNTPYVIDSNNIDHYPLMNRPIIPELPPYIILPLMMMATLLAVTFHHLLHRSIHDPSKLEQLRLDKFDTSQFGNPIDKRTFAA